MDSPSPDVPLRATRFVYVPLTEPRADTQRCRRREGARGRTRRARAGVGGKRERPDEGEGEGGGHGACSGSARLTKAQAARQVRGNVVLFFFVRLRSTTWEYSQRQI